MNILEMSYPLPKLQRIKLSEYQRFFRQLPEYDLHLNHLGEIAWIREDDSSAQHEFYHYEPGLIERLKKSVDGQSALDKLTPEDQALHLRFRQYLEEQYLDKITRETAGAATQLPEVELSDQQIEDIPLTIQHIRSAPWNWSLIGAMAAGLFGILFLAIAFLLPTGSAQNGRLMIQSNEAGAQVLIAGDQVGYVNSIIPNLKSGDYEIQVIKPGFQSQNDSYRARIIADSTTLINVQLVATISRNSGFLVIDSQHRDSRLFINGDYFGNLNEHPVIALTSGEYQISLQKSGFVSSPKAQSVQISAGDTSQLAFSQRRAKDLIGERLETGSIDISSNENGVRIFLNGKDSGFEADHVFTDLPFGRYRVELKKDGFRTIPPIHELVISEGNPSAQLQFELISQSGNVRIETQPVAGSIFINDKPLAEGLFEQDLPLGSHQVHFGAVDGYLPPPPQTLVLDGLRSINQEVYYFPKLNIEASISDVGALSIKDGTLVSGYTLPGRGFSASSEGGPEVVFHPDLEDYVWKFGFAFPYRDPRGGDGIQLSFTLPRQIDSDIRFDLKLLGAASKEQYPLTLSGKTLFRIKVNGEIINLNQRYRFLEDTGGLLSQSWNISKQLRPGKNILELGIHGDNTRYYLIKSLQIVNSR